jgi:hypothetical protein
MVEAGNKTGLASGSSLTWAYQEIALGVYGTAVPTPPQVTLRGPCGAFPAVNDANLALVVPGRLLAYGRA